MSGFGIPPLRVITFTDLSGRNETKYDTNEVPDPYQQIC